MSELFMECVEEELEPWQKQVPQVHLIEDDDDDDEPIFVGVLSNNQKDDYSHSTPPQKKGAGSQMKIPAPHPTAGPSPIMLPLGVPVTTVSATPSLTTVTPQPVIVNNQGFIVSSPQFQNNNQVIASLGTTYPPGTSFTVVPATSGVVHRPQIQEIKNNIVTLSNVQGVAMYSPQQNQSKLPIMHTLNTISVRSVPVQDGSGNNKDQNLLKRGLQAQDVANVIKKAKLDSSPSKVTILVENGTLKKFCSKCQQEFLTEDALKIHMLRCHAIAISQAPSGPNTNPNKLIMLVADFYYGRSEGDAQKQQPQKTNTTFKCQSCLKVLKNNIRFMNHMKHHLELEKQNSESWESHTTCHHCYRQYTTPFQLQCHIESAHSPIESSTNCKICEVAFDSEQVLLEHMKTNHKPGEMPYVCQVCSYRSSFFSDVETHFRSVHENTKDLLCPFCLKVVRTCHIYMQHYMKHQKKGIHRCGKCRLNFLTYKEKVEHKTSVHKTFRKPKALEGLPPGTKVTIRASLTGKGPAIIGPDSCVDISSADPQIFSSAKAKGVSKLNSKAGRAKNKTGPKAEQNKKQERRKSKNNLALKYLSPTSGCFTCIECNKDVKDFLSHFPMLSHCGACSYSSSCKVSIGNHMIKFHSTIPKNKRFKVITKKNSSGLKLTLICLNCELLVDASGGDLMSKHLTDQPDHTCKVVQDKDKAGDKEQNRVDAPPQSADLTPEPTDSKEPSSVAGDVEAEPKPPSPPAVSRHEEEASGATAGEEEPPAPSGPPVPAPEPPHTAADVTE